MKLNFGTYDRSIATIINDTPPSPPSLLPVYHFQWKAAAHKHTLSVGMRGKYSRTHIRTHVVNDDALVDVVVFVVEGIDACVYVCVRDCDVII